MARPTSEKVGRGVCPDKSCGQPVMYRRSSGGMLTHRCDCCDSSGYAEPGGTAHAARMATIEKPSPSPTGDPVPPAPEKKPGFALGDL